MKYEVELTFKYVLRADSQAEALKEAYESVAFDIQQGYRTSFYGTAAYDERIEELEDAE